MRALYRFRTHPELAFVEKPIEVVSEGRVTIRREAVDSPWLLLEFDSEVTNDHELPQVAAPLILTLSLVAFEHGVAIYDDDASLQPRVRILRGGVLQDATCRATATVSPLPPHGLLLALAAVPRCCSLPHQDKISLELYHAAATTVSPVAQCVLFTAVVQRLAKGVTLGRRSLRTRVITSWKTTGSMRTSGRNGQSSTRCAPEWFTAM